MRYSITIETDNHSVPVGSFGTKAGAIWEAGYYRTGGLGWRGKFSALENPNVQVYDTKKGEVVYCRPMFKYALKK
jgi:hypothetical protein